MKFKIGDILRPINLEGTGVQTFKIKGYSINQKKYYIIPLVFVFKHQSFNQEYVDNKCIFDKEYIWKEQIKQIVNED